MTKNYNAAQVSVIFGPNILSGFADGSFVTCARDEQAFTKKTGTDGQTTRSRSNNKGGTVILRLDQASASNDVLSVIAVLDELSGAGIFPILVTDKSGRSGYASEDAWIQKQPDAEFDRDALDREWIFDCGNLKMFSGGN